MKDHLPIAAIYGNYFYYDTEVVQKLSIQENTAVKYPNKNIRYVSIADLENEFRNARNVLQGAQIPLRRQPAPQPEAANRNRLYRS